MAFDTSWLVHLAMLGYVAGFLFREQVTLRLLVMGGTALYIAYYYYHPISPLWDAIYASIAIMAANIVGLGRLLYNRVSVGLTPEQRPVLAALQPLEPGDFRRLMRIGRRRAAEGRETLTTEGRLLDHVYFVVSGEMTGAKDGVAFPVAPGAFIGEVSFMLRGPATAGIEIAPGGVWYEWRKDDLRQEMERSPRLAQCFEALIGRDLARKVAGARGVGAVPNKG